MLHHLCQDGTEIALSTSEGGSSEGSLRISSWYECFIPQIGFLARAVSEICIWLEKTNCTLKEPQIEKSVFGFLMPADSLVSAQVTFTSPLKCFFNKWKCPEVCFNLNLWLMMVGHVSLLDLSVLLLISTTWHVPAAPPTAPTCCSATR